MHTRSLAGLWSLVLGLGLAGSWAPALADDQPAAPAAAPEGTSTSGARVAPSPSERLAEDAKLYRQFLYTLADPFMEGRAPGTTGNRRAADYLEFNYRALGLQPAFPQSSAGENAPLEAGGKSYRQTFIAPPSLRPGDSVKLEKQAMRYTARGETITLEGKRDFNVLGYSASKSITGPLAFVGYSIVQGQDGYTSYPSGADGSPATLEGKIALVMRFEPMTSEGKSKWSETRWSAAADLRAKVDAAIERKAAGVILVNPPGADDPRAGRLEDISFGLSARALEVPVVMMTTEAADAMVKAFDPAGRSLMDLRQLADEGGAMITWDNATLAIDAAITRMPLWTDNVGAVLPGVGSLADDIIVVGSHYDHVGYGYFGSRMGAAARGKLHPGADDNASGTSGNLLSARRISEALRALPEGTPRRTVLFLAFCAEESGLNGSRHYVQNPIADLKRHTLMINMDMIGRLRDTKLELGGVGTGEGLQDFLTPYVDASGLTVAMKKSGQGPSDHASFASAGVPALFFFTGLHDQYHAPTDTPDTINVDGAVQVADLVSRIVIDAATREAGFPFTSPTGGLPGTNDNAGPTTGMGGVKVRFGIAPGDYSGEEEGVLVGEVMPGLPADKAGLKAGDLMVEWDGRKLRDVEGWMPMLAAHKPGDVVRITYVRDGARLITEATLVARGTPNQ